MLLYGVVLLLLLLYLSVFGLWLGVAIAVLLCPFVIIVLAIVHNSRLFHSISFLSYLFIAEAHLLTVLRLDEEGYCFYTLLLFVELEMGFL